MDLNLITTIILSVILVINILGFLIFFFNKSRRNSGSLIPNFIMIKYLIQSILTYTLITSLNDTIFLKSHILPLIFDKIQIYFSMSSYLGISIKFMNSVLFISTTIYGFIIEILYCIESILLFQNPVSSTKFRKPIYIFILCFFGAIIITFTFVNKFYKLEECSIDTYNIFTKNFWSDFHNCISILYNSDEKQIILNIQMILKSTVILIIIYTIIACISIYYIFLNINQKSVLFIKQKIIFRQEHIIYVIISILSLIVFLIVCYAFSTSEIAIILSLTAFGTFGCLIRFLEIDFFRNQFKGIRGNYINNEGINETAIKEFKVLSNDLKSQKKEMKESLLGKDNNNYDNDIDSMSEKSGINNNLSIINNPPLSSQISSNFLSESVFYIVMCILNTAEEKKNENETYISLIMNTSDKKYSNIQEHTVKIKDNKFIGIKTKECFQKTQLNFNLFDQHEIKILEYAPDIFHNILKADKISYEQIIESFNLESNIINLSKFAASEGQSGSIFFHTHDKKFIIKTISSSELNAMKDNLLLNYYKLLTENTFSILTRIYGLYTLKIGISVVHMVLMENIFPYESDYVLYKFDLKGSYIGRKTKNLFQKKDVTLKDIDYCELSSNRSDIKLSFLKNDIIKIKKTFISDLKILEKGNLMDYSFFICICRNENIDNNRLLIKERMFKSKNKDIVYLLGIIDYLSIYNKRKIIENAIKNLFHKTDSFSAVNQTKYRKRFQIFMKAVVKGEDNLFLLLKELNSGKDLNKLFK
jgi:hypothetical protein